MIQHPDSVPEPQSCPQSELMRYPYNSTKSLGRQKDTNVPKQNEKPALNHMTNLPKAIMATKIPFELQAPSASLWVRPVDSILAKGLETPHLSSQTEKTDIEVGDGQKEKRNHRLKLALQVSAFK